MCIMDKQAVASEIQGLIETGRDFHHRGWSLATSSNYSVVTGRDPLRLLVTCSGFDKGRLTPEQFVIVGEDGKSVSDSGRKPSAEVLLHVALVRCTGAGSVLHTHSIWGTLLSEVSAVHGYLEISGYEMLKAFAGIRTHEVTVRVEVLGTLLPVPTIPQVVNPHRCLPDRSSSALAAVGKQNPGLLFCYR
jgi:methylthioribulose-1-phosphate dehydratase